MKTFFDTYRIYHETLEERHAVIEVVKQHFPYADLHYWGDRWAPHEWPYMHFYTDREHGSLYSTRGSKSMMPVAEFLAMFREDVTEDENMDAVYLLV